MPTGGVDRVSRHSVRPRRLPFINILIVTWQPGLIELRGSELALLQIAKTTPSTRMALALPIGSYRQDSTLFQSKHLALTRLRENNRLELSSVG